MIRIMLKEIVARIESRLDDLELSAASASLEAGLSNSAIRNLQRAAKKGSENSVRLHTIVALAKRLDTTPNWIITGESPDVDQHLQLYPRPIVRKAILAVIERVEVTKVNPDELSDLILDICDYIQRQKDDQALDNVIDFSAARLSKS